MPLDVLSSAVTAAKRIGEPISLRELLKRHRQGRSTAGLTAITFDDAYAALLRGAAAFLQSAGVPSTIFVASDFARSGGRFWWDRLEDAHSRTPVHRWRKFEQVCGLPDEYRIGQSPEYGPLRPFRQWILAAHQGRWPSELEPFLDTLEHELGVLTAHRSMTFDELSGLCSSSLFEIGVHTSSHPVLPLLSREEQKLEITESHRALRERFDCVLPVLAIPFGLFDRDTARLAREAGMDTSLTLAGTTLRGAAEPDALPRFCITRGEAIWKLQLRLSGIVDRARRWRGDPISTFPPLPSATS